MEEITKRRSSLVRLIEERAPLVLIVFHIHLMTYNGDYRTRADGDLFVPIILRSILITIFKEERFEFTSKTDSINFLIYIGMSFQHLAPK